MIASFTLFIEAYRISNKDKVLESFALKTGLEYEIVSVERYWKDASQFKIRLRSEYTQKSYSEMIIFMLGSLCDIALHWTTCYEDDQFSAVTDKTNIPGLQRIYYEITNGVSNEH